MTDTERLRRLDRENEELRDMLNQVAWRLGLGDEVHYYADNYLACQLRVLDAIEGLTERESDVETVRSDAMEAWQWVRRRGGLATLQLHEETFADMMRQRDEYRDLARGYERDARWVRDHGGLNQVEMDYAMGEGFSDLADEVARRLGLCIEGLDAQDSRPMLMEALDRRLMPEGMEWPRYEDGEPVRIGGAIADGLGHAHEVTSVELYDDGADLHWNLSEPEECVWVGHGESAKRPAVLAADGEPLEVGQTVWRIDTGAEYWVKSGQTITSDAVVIIRKTDCDCESEIVKASQLTHQRPALDAEGNRIEPAMDVWWVCEGDERGIHAEKLHVESIGEDGLVTCDPFNGGTWVELEPSELYVKKPALDADGVLCREGDEVWEVRSHRRREIVATHYLDYETGEPLILCDGDDAIPIPATCVTHAKPEPPDSWERIEEDAELDICVYFNNRRDVGCVDCPANCQAGCETKKSRDLVRRCKALAEVECDLVRRCKSMAERCE